MDSRTDALIAFVSNSAAQSHLASDLQRQLILFGNILRSPADHLLRLLELYNRQRIRQLIAVNILSWSSRRKPDGVTDLAGNVDPTLVHAPRRIESVSELWKTLFLRYII